MAKIENFNNYFEFQLPPDKMSAILQLKQEYHLELNFSPEDLKEELQDRKLSFGWNEPALQLIADGLKKDAFPVTVATGVSPHDGKDGQVIYEKEKQTTHIRNDKEKIDFRDVMKIPSVHSGEKLASFTEPTEGEQGTDVLGEPVEPKPGKPVKLKPGKNSEWNENERAIYATMDGQVSVDEKSIHVYPLYEVSGDLDMKTGNLDFVGTIVIRGNVPTGYTVKAKGDVKVYGLVEGANIIADGSVFISEGIVGTHKGGVFAGLDVRVGYINQGNVEAGRDIFVEHSLLHSQCIAKENIYCQRGNIIGGSLSAGLSIEGKDVGNKMNTKTELFFGVNKKILEKEQALSTQKEQLQDSLAKLKLIGEKLKEKEQKISPLTSKEKVMLLRQRNSVQTSTDQLKEVTAELSEIKKEFSEMAQTKLTVNGTLYANIDVSFGKYRRKILQNHKFVQITYEHGEIVVTSL